MAFETQRALSSIFASSSRNDRAGDDRVRLACFSTRSRDGAACRADDRNGFEILAWSIVKLSDATASLSVTSMLLISTSWTKGLGISSACALVGEAATSSATAAHRKRAQYRIGRPHRPATASGPARPRVRTEPDPSPGRLSHSCENGSTVAADLHRKLADHLMPDSRSASASNLRWMRRCIQRQPCVGQACIRCAVSRHQPT